jgi:hypothetical protein
MSTTPVNYRKLETARLLKLLDSTTISELEQKEVKAILEDRQRRQAKATAAIELADVQGLLKRYELNWEIQLLPVAVAIVSPMEGEEPFENLEAVHYHDTLCWPIRMDTNKLLGRFASNADKPIIQNKELVELGIRLANSEDSEVTFAKTINDGASIIISIRAGGETRVGPDVVQRYIYLLDNRTGEHGLRIGFGETNLRCTNQMNFVNRNAAHSLRHTKTFHSRIEALIESYDALNEEMEQHQQFVESLAAHTISDERWNDAKYEFIDLLLDVDLQEDFSGVRVPAGYEVAVLLDDCIEVEREAIGQSLWTLINGVTRMTTHERDQLYPRSETPELYKDIAYGKAGEIAAKAYEILQTL